LHRLAVDRGLVAPGGVEPAPLNPRRQVLDEAHARTSARRPSSTAAARSQSASVGTIAIRTYPSPSGPKNDPGATTTSPRSSSSSAQSYEARPPGTATHR